MATLSADTLAIVLGFDWRKKVAARLLGRLSTGLGIIALIAAVVLFSTRRRTGRRHTRTRSHRLEPVPQQGVDDDDETRVDPAVPSGDHRRGHRRPAPATCAHALAAPGDRGRLVPGRADPERKDTGRGLARDYDWRRFERKLNGFAQFVTEIDGVDVHFIHVRSPNPGALALVLTHGWPGSNADYLNVIGPLTDPVAFGGDPADSFDVIIPSMPGFGFSGKPSETGWSVERTARAWVELVRRLGYDRWAAQGGDWGGMVTLTLGAMEPDGLVGIHVHSAYAFPARLPESPTPEEQAALAGLARYAGELGGSNHLQATKPETVGIALADSPAGQAAWIYEKYQSKTDNQGRAEDAISTFDMLDEITLAWFTNTGASSGRVYWENRAVGATGPTVKLPVAVTLFPRDLPRPTRGWVELAYPNLVYCNEAERGGHFAALEQPGTLIADIRAGLRDLRPGE